MLQLDKWGIVFVISILIVTGCGEDSTLLENNSTKKSTSAPQQFERPIQKEKDKTISKAEEKKTESTSVSMPEEEGTVLPMVKSEEELADEQTKDTSDIVEEENITVPKPVKSQEELLSEQEGTEHLVSEEKSPEELADEQSDNSQPMEK